MVTPYLSIIIPAYNEERRIGSTLECLLRYLDGQPYTWEVIVADDGSADGTAPLVERLAKDADQVRLLSLPHRGKGWAVRQGMLAARGQLRFMADADMAMPVEQLGTFLDRMADGYDIVIGSRQIGGARRFGESLFRHVRGRVFNLTVRLLAVGGFQDTQCGFKCFKAEVAEELFRLQKTDGLGFDVELLYLAAKRRLNILELPIDWHHQADSRLRPLADTYLMLRDILLIRLRDIGGSYRV
jgi:glycosyltransferase involved in cell wall biosynthesis